MVWRRRRRRRCSLVMFLFIHLLTFIVKSTPSHFSALEAHVNERALLINNLCLMITEFDVPPELNRAESYVHVRVLYAWMYI